MLGRNKRMSGGTQSTMLMLEKDSPVENSLCLPEDNPITWTEVYSLQPCSLVILELQRLILSAR